MNKIYNSLNENYNIAKTYYGEENIFGIYCYGDKNEIEVIVIPSFEKVCLNEPLIDTFFRNSSEYIKVKDIRFIYNATAAGMPEMLEGLYTDYYIVNPRYEHMYLKLLRANRDKISAGTAKGVPAKELQIALIKILRTAFNDNSAAVRFIKQTTDAEKLALEAIVHEIGDEGTFSQYKVAASAGISRVTMSNLIMKMELNQVAVVQNMGPHGTYIKIIDDTLLNPRGLKSI